jgi:hypothetical protein
MAVGTAGFLAPGARFAELASASPQRISARSCAIVAKKARRAYRPTRCVWA